MALYCAASFFFFSLKLGEILFLWLFIDIFQCMGDDCPELKLCKKCRERLPKNSFKTISRTLKNGDVKVYFYKACTECSLKVRKLYRDNNRTKIRKSSKKYRDNNKDKIKEARRLYKKRPYVKISRRVSKSLYRHIKDGSFSSTLKILPYTMLELKQHIESQFEPWMNWDNWGCYDPETFDKNPSWQLDHIKPLSSFNIQKFGDEEFMKAWALDNLRPLNSKQNIIEGARLLKPKST